MVPLQVAQRGAAKIRSLGQLGLAIPRRLA